MKDTQDLITKRKTYRRLRIVTILIGLSVIPIFALVWFLLAMASVFDLPLVLFGGKDPSIWRDSGFIIIPVLLFLLLLAQLLRVAWDAYKFGLYKKVSNFLFDISRVPMVWNIEIVRTVLAFR